MQLRKPKNHTVIDMYKAWCKIALQGNSKYYKKYDYRMKMTGCPIIYCLEEGKEVMIMSYTMFRLIIETYNKYAGEAIIEGQRFTLGAQLGYIAGGRMERNMNKIRCDMVATRRAREIDPTHPAIFYTDPDLYLIWWTKLHKIKNETVYTFVPAKHTLQAQFYRAIAANPILKTNFRYYPYTYFNTEPQTQSA
jgi:hypothetical protein